MTRTSTGRNQGPTAPRARYFFLCSLVLALCSWPVGADPLETLPRPRLLPPAKSSTLPDTFAHPKRPHTSEKAMPKANNSGREELPSTRSPTLEEVLNQSSPPNKDAQAPPGGNSCPLYYTSLSLPVLQPVYEGFNAFNQSTLVGTTTTATQTPFPYDFAVCPLLTLGFTDTNHFGGRIRGLFLDQISTIATVNSAPEVGTRSITTPMGVSSVLTPGTGLRDDLAFRRGLRLDTVDVEATCIFQAGHWTFWASSGLRYLYLMQQYRVDRARTFPIGSGSWQYENGVAGTNFTSCGLTVALEAQQPIFNGLGLYSNARGSALFGRSRRSQSTYLHDITPTADTTTTTYTNNNSYEMLAGLEMEVGLQYQMQWGRLLPMVRLGFVGQMYFGAGTPFQEVGNLGLLGLNTTLGLAF